MSKLRVKYAYSGDTPKVVIPKAKPEGNVPAVFDYKLTESDLDFIMHVRDNLVSIPDACKPVGKAAESFELFLEGVGEAVEEIWRHRDEAMSNAQWMTDAVFLLNCFMLQPDDKDIYKAAEAWLANFLQK